MSDYSVYIIECSDGSLYTGIAIDVERRIREHTRGVRGARYLRGRGPLRLAYCERVGNRSTAQQIEAQIKRQSRVRKLSLIDGTIGLDDLIASQESVISGS